MKVKQLIEILSELEAAARALQLSLLERDTDNIWQQLSRQEYAVDALNSFSAEEQEELEAAVVCNPQVRHLLYSGMRVVQANRALSRRFLDVIGRTLSRLGGSEGSSTYTDNIRAGSGRAPVLVHTQG